MMLALCLQMGGSAPRPPTHPFLGHACFEAYASSMMRALCLQMGEAVAPFNPP